MMLRTFWFVKPISLAINTLSLAPKVVKDHQGTSFIVVEGKLRPKPVGSLSALPILLT